MIRPEQRPASNSTARKRAAERVTDHSIVWEFDDGSIRGHAECAAPEGADCRLGPQSFNDCQCESWNILRDDDAAPYHLADGSDRAIGDRHYMTDLGECQVELWLAEEYDVAEVCDESSPFVLGRTPIETVWESDHVRWKRAAR